MLTEMAQGRGPGVAGTVLSSDMGGGHEGFHFRIIKVYMSFFVVFYS